MKFKAGDVVINKKDNKRYFVSQSDNSSSRPYLYVNNDIIYFLDTNDKTHWYNMYELAYKPKIRRKL